MRVHDSFMTILCDGNNIPYTLLYVIHINGLYCKGIWCGLITQLLKCCIFIYCFSYANYIKVSKSDRRFVA